jgi:hypothetical protein
MFRIVMAFLLVHAKWPIMGSFQRIRKSTWEIRFRLWSLWAGSCKLRMLNDMPYVVEWLRDVFN